MAQVTAVRDHTRARVPALEPEGVVLARRAAVPRRPVSGAEDRARALGLVIPDFHADGYYGGDFGSMKSHHVVEPRAVPVRPRSRGPGRAGAPRSARSRRHGRAGLRGGAPDGSQLPGRHPLRRRLARSRPLPDPEPLLRGGGARLHRRAPGLVRLLRPAARRVRPRGRARRRARRSASRASRTTTASSAGSRSSSTIRPMSDARLSDVGRSHAIATPHAATSAAGDAIFRRGGNGIRRGRRGRRGADRSSTRTCARSAATSSRSPRRRTAPCGS